MTWEPISHAELSSLIAEELPECSAEHREVWERTRIEPQKWRQTPWGDEGGGFWAVAVLGDQVLWFNDIEYGFNVSTFTTPGEIPEGQYWCNQDALRFALMRF
jgi:hypothetical protein